MVDKVLADGEVLPIDEVLAEKVLKNVTAQAEMETLEVVEVERGKVAFTVTAPESVANYHGAVHGGFLATLLEVAAGMVGTTLGVNNVALTSSVNFIKLAPLGPLVVKAEASHAGRSTVVVRCRVEAPDGTLHTEATFTLFVLPGE